MILDKACFTRHLLRFCETATNKLPTIAKYRKSHSPPQELAAPLILIYHISYSISARSFARSAIQGRHHACPRGTIDCVARVMGITDGLAS